MAPSSKVIHFGYVYSISLILWYLIFFRILCFVLSLRIWEKNPCVSHVTRNIVQISYQHLFEVFFVVVFCFVFIFSWLVYLKTQKSKAKPNLLVCFKKKPPKPYHMYPSFLQCYSVRSFLKFFFSGSSTHLSTLANTEPCFMFSLP